MKKTLKITAFALMISLVTISCKKKVEEKPEETKTEVATPEVEAPVVVETVSAVAPEVVQKVNDALKDFPNVKAEVVNDELTISGSVTPDQARNIKMSVDALKVGKVNYNYTK